ncbi:MAG: polysaccharide pyruvyl transferase family protein [Anaerolineae bacterium]|nr:polysaccharide pyruvyl transferase family protein [Anaerolineae bacterium]
MDIPVQANEAVFGALARLVPIGGTVLLIGNYGSRNLGDETILWAILRYLNDVHQRRATFIVPSRCPEEVGRFLGKEREALRPCDITGLRDILTHLGRSDLVLIGGGGIFSAYTGPLARAVPLFAILAKVLGKRVAYFGLGFYDTTPRWLRTLVNLSFLMADLVVLRDRHSLDLLWGPLRRSPRTLLGRDLVLYLEEMPGPGVGFSLPTDSALAAVAARLHAWRAQGHRVVAISLKPTRDRPTNERLLAEGAAALRAWEQKGARFALFPFAMTSVWYEDDVAFLTTLAERAHLAPDSYVLVPHSHPFGWVRLLREETDLMIAMRFHAQVFAHLALVPFYAIVYERKNEGFLTELGHADRCRVEEVRADVLNDWAAPLLTAARAEETA